jgi:hypothetical protein
MIYIVIGLGFMMGWAILASLIRIEKLIKLQMNMSKDQVRWGWGKHK